MSTSAPVTAPESAGTSMPSQCPHIQLMDPAAYQGGAPREQYRILRESFPVCWMDDPYTDTGYWAVTRHAELDSVSKRPQLFSSEAKSPMPNEMKADDLALQRTLMLFMDPPDHIKYRRIVRNAFTPAAVDSYRAHFVDVARGLVDKVLVAGECEFVSEIASELPLVAICEILGVPLTDRQQFFGWSNTLIGSDDPDYCASDEERLQASVGLYAYADKVMAQFKDKPQDDIVGALLSGQVNGESLGEDEFRSFMLLLIVAGNETTRNQTTHLMRLLIENPEQYQMLVDDPSRVPDAVHEALRYNSPVIAFRRTAMQDVELGGQQIKAGDKVVLFYQSASSDESFFTDPDRFDITRPRREPVEGQLRAFGIGEHFCLGSHLAKLQMNVVLEAIVERVRKPRLNGEVRWLWSHFINGIKEMPIKFDAAA